MGRSFQLLLIKKALKNNFLKKIDSHFLKYLKIFLHLQLMANVPSKTNIYSIQL